MVHLPIAQTLLWIQDYCLIFNSMCLAPPTVTTTLQAILFQNYGSIHV